MTPATREHAVELLQKLNAPPRLQRHGELVAEAAELIIAGLQQLEIPVHADFVRVRAVLHDVGKTLHSSELDQPGSAHESAANSRCCNQKSRSMGCSKTWLQALTSGSNGACASRRE